VTSDEIGFLFKPIQIPCQEMNEAVWQRISIDGWSVVGRLGYRVGVMVTGIVGIDDVGLVEL
jgi:hypothetical protein